MVSFKDLCSFIEKQAAKLTQPLMGDISDKKENVPKNKDNNTGAKRKVFATNTQKPQERNCICCKKTNHRLENCFFFEAKSQEEKSKFIKDHRLCFTCLGENHMTKSCNSQIVCKKCKGKHATVMHRPPKNKENSATEGKATEETAPKAALKPAAAAAQETEKIEDRNVQNAPKKALAANTGAGTSIKRVTAAVPVKLHIDGSDVTVTTYMGMDPFCTDCFMNEKLLSELGVQGVESVQSITTLHNKNKKINTKVVYNLKISDLDGNVSDCIPVVYSKSEWPFDAQDSPRSEDLKQYPMFRQLPFQFINKEIGLLVGLSVPRIIKPLKILNGPSENSAYVALHKFGYALNGPVKTENENQIKSFFVKNNNEQNMEQQFEKFCAQEFKDEYAELLGPSVLDLQFLKIMNESLQKTSDGHFEVSLPFKESDFTLTSNKEQVYNRLISASRRLRVDPEFYTEYKQFMDLMLDSGFAEKIPYHQLTPPAGKVWYLYHFGVRHKQKKKIRIVFDASLKFKGVSLNDMLLQGPDLTSSLLGVLLRFRQGKFSFTADIQKMFYQIRVPEEQRDYLRYFWFPDGDLNKPPEEYRVRVHIFGAVSSPSCSNFVLKHTSTMDEAGKFQKDSRDTILKNFYVDDCLKSMDSEAEAVRIVQEVKQIVALGGFHLTSFVSNSREVLNVIPEDDLAKDLKMFDLTSDELLYEKALGVVWETKEDTLGIRLKLPENPCTKRGILSTTFSIYDPLGLAAPALLPAKKIFQLACYEKTDWNSELSPQLGEKWKNWLQNISELQKFTVPRCFKSSSNIQETQLHLFSDGSETAYAAVGYLRFVDTTQNVHCSLVMAKTSLVPLKSSALTTIPRIELNGAKLAVRIQKIIQQELEIKIDKTLFWTDSTTVLKYLNSKTNRFQRFVSNRVAYV